ncbi:MAG: polysaccharide deacetylase family protein [Pseudomonadota bacterium]|nr:polysaccharide deacetylase family protein [Pseudomonadota bacterium]
MLLHAAAPATVLMLPDAWPFAVGAIAGNHVLLGFAGLSPRSSLLGPNLTRLPASSAARGELALTIDDGPDPLVTPQVLDILDRHGAKASFFCVGDEALRYPELCQEIVRRGHAVENHSQSHSPYFALFGPRRIAVDVDHGQQTLRALAGETPRFFRPTAGLRNVFLDPVLARRGLQLATWTRRGFDTRERRADVVFRRLARNLAGGDILTLHDGNAARTAAGVPVIIEVLPRLLDAIREAGLHPVTLRSAIP